MAISFYDMVLLNIDSFFGAKKILYSQIDELINKSPELIVWAAPVLFLFFLLEWFIPYRQKKAIYNEAETIVSVLVCIGNLAIAFALKFSLIFRFVWVYNLVPWRIKFSWWSFISCYIIFDFCSYWAYRIARYQRILWATHIVHHTSEHFNLTVSFRLSCPPWLSGKIY